MISPNLDSIYLKKMKEDSFYENVKERIEDEKRLTTFKEDWNDTEELKVAMKSGYEEILSDEVLIKKVEEKIKNLSPFLSEYNVELDFLNQGELKVISNTLSEELGLKKEFDDVEIFKDLTKQKDLEFDFKEETVNNFNKNCELGLKDIFEDWRANREKNILTDEVKGVNIDISSESTKEDFYQYISTFGSEKIKDKILLEEISLFDDYEVDKNVLKSLEDNYNKEHNINDFKGYMVALNKEQEQMKEDKELLEKFRKKDNLISNKDLKHFNEQINENKKNFLSFLKEKDYLEKVDDENYKIKDDIFKKDGFEKILSDYEDETMYCFHTRENIFRGNLTDEELLERYDIKKEDFIIYSQNGDKLYDSESSLPTRDLEEYIIDIKNEEYWEKELKTDKYKDYNAFYIFDNTMTRTEMVERYDLDKKLSPFEIYTNDGDLLYNSASENNDFDKIREYAKENLANYDFEEFINEDLTKFENWQKVTTYDVGIGITELNGEKKQIYDVYDYTDPVYKELCQEIDKERVNFEEEIRLSFKEHIDNNIIKSDDLLKVFKKFDNGNDKRLERFEEKINNIEISAKEVEEKSKDREKDL